MKLKTVEVSGKTYAEIQDGKPIYVHDDGKEVPHDAPATIAKIGQLNGEARSHREAKEAVEAKLKPFEGIEDPEAAKKALETVQNLDEGKLLTAGKAEEYKAAAKRAAEEQVAAARKLHIEELDKTQKERDGLRAALYEEKIGGAFARSKYIADKVAVPADIVQARFGQSFKVEEGKVVAYDVAGNKVFSRARPGELADFEEALELLVDKYPQKDAILKGTGNSGTGARQSNGGGNNGAKTITRAAFDALPADQRMKTMHEKVQVVD